MPKAAATRRRQAPPGRVELHVAIHWRVDAASLRRAGHWKHRGGAGEDVALTLALVISDGIARAEATLSAGDRARALRLPRALASARCIVTEAEDLSHVDAPPILTATLAPGARPRVLYARSGVLEFLRLPGGRYEVAGGAVRGTVGEL